MDLLKTFETEIGEVDVDYGKILRDDLPAFNHALESSNLSSLLVALNSVPAKQE
jgi:hypothetical protein